MIKDPNKEPSSSGVNQEDSQLQSEIKILREQVGVKSISLDNKSGTVSFNLLTIPISI